MIQFLFPILVDYQHDPSRIGQDFMKTGLYLLLVLVATLVLAPNRRNNHHHHHKSSSSALTVVVGTPRKAKSFHYNQDGNSPTSPPRFLSNYYCQTAPNSDNWSDTPSFTDEETDEDRFERMWPVTIAHSDYRRLVLPPVCRRMQPTERHAAPPADQETDYPRENEEEATNDDDNPVARLQYYVKSILWLIRSLLSYDYAGAGWTLISWLQGIRRKRRTNSCHSLEQLQNEDSSVATESRRSTLNSTRSSASGENSPFGTPKQLHPLPSLSLSSPEEKKDGSAKPTSSFSIPILPNSSSASKLLVVDNTDGAASLPPRGAVLMPRGETDETNNTANASKVFHRRRQRAAEDAVATDLTNTGRDNLLHRIASMGDDADEQDENPPEENHRQQSQSYYFETMNTQDSLKRLNVDVPVPDKNGYILGDDFLPDSRHTPLLVFVNSRSGPQQGHLLITQLRRLLNPIQVWDLNNGGPDEILESFLVLTRLRILVCGGDGTVSWIISALEKMNLQRKWPPIAILPLGTGNDLARIHGWGGGFNNESLIGILKQISESYISMLDRWELTITDGSGKKRKKEMKNFFNYLGVGADAQAALQVHYLRESRPDWFFSRMVNKAWYGIFGAEDIIKASSVNVRKEIKLFADGVEIPLPPDSQGIILLNIDSYAGGVPLWSHGVKAEGPIPAFPTKSPPRRSVSLGNFSNSLPRRINSLDSMDEMSAQLSEEERTARVTACDRPSSCQDGLLDVVSIRGAFHLGQIKVGLSNAQRLCQCREATIVIKNKVAVQVDGEPWRQRPCTLRIHRKADSATMLHRSADDGGVETEMSKLLEWAEERQLIDGQVHSILLKEFSRRIESKTRQRRVRPKDNNIMSTLKRAISANTVSNMQTIHSSHGGIAF